VGSVELVRANKGAKTRSDCSQRFHFIWPCSCYRFAACMALVVQQCSVVVWAGKRSDRVMRRVNELAVVGVIVAWKRISGTLRRRAGHTAVARVLVVASVVCGMSFQAFAFASRHQLTAAGSRVCSVVSALRVRGNARTAAREPAARVGGPKLVLARPVRLAALGRRVAEAAGLAAVACFRIEEKCRGWKN
jgi:hypothetical protein